MGKTYQSIHINAPVDKVWSAVRNFHDLSWAKGVIETVEVLGDKKSDQLGARRKLNGVFVETLLAIDDDARSLGYSIDEAPGTPVADATDYRGAIRVTPVTHGDTTVVEWSSVWSGNDSACSEFCSGVYNGALGAMKAHFEG